MEKKKSILVVLLLGCLQGPGSQELPGDSWPGMGPRIVRLAQHLVSTARVVILAEPGKPSRTIWVKTTRRYRKENGWFGLMVNGEVLPEKFTFLEYGGRTENLQLLFTLGQRFAEEPPAYTWDYPPEE